MRTTFKSYCAGGEHIISGAAFLTLNPQGAFCCNLQTHTIIENARLKLLTIAMATSARFLRCTCLAAQAGFRHETPLRI